AACRGPLLDLRCIVGTSIACGSNTGIRRITYLYATCNLRRNAYALSQELGWSIRNDWRGDLHCCRSYEAVTKGKGRGSGTIVGPRLCEDVADVDVDCPLAQ